MKRPILFALAATLLLSACGTTSPTRGDPGPSAEAPTNDAPVLTAEQCAAVRAEPLPPAGVSSSAVVRGLATALGEDLALDFWEWLTVTYPGWARENAIRLTALRAACPSS